MDQKVREMVRQRAQGVCEYCRIPQRFYAEKFHIEHIIAKQHRGTSEVTNLAVACHHCNLHKGPNIAGRDPLTNELTRLFHPRQDKWEDHFRLVADGLIAGSSPIGRTTSELLEFNTNTRAQLRTELAKLGFWNV